MTTIRGIETLEEALVNRLASIKPGGKAVKLVEVADHVEVAVSKAVSVAPEVKEDMMPSVGETTKEFVATVGMIDDEAEASSDVLGRMAQSDSAPVPGSLSASPPSSIVMLMAKELEFPLI